jgi:hypothetical protein
MRDEVVGSLLANVDLKKGKMRWKAQHNEDLCYTVIIAR